MTRKNKLMLAAAIVAAVLLVGSGRGKVHARPKRVD